MSNEKKSAQKKYGLLEEVPVAEEPFEMISLDTVGGFNYHNSQKKYLHIVLDHATRYAWTFPSKTNRPQCNGKNERVNQTLVAKLRCKVNSTTKTPWTKLLEQVTYEYNNSPHDVTGFSPAYLMFGTLPYDSPLPNQAQRALTKVNDSRLIRRSVRTRHLYTLHGFNDYLPLRQMLQGCLGNPRPVPIPKEHLTSAALIRAV
ncbi:retrotransposable element Tf2 protein type 1 [Trichonephila clavipes]|nr:retrotransposable element Tf2 protein type 1 [Trichonephila clavipes]